MDSQRNRNHHTWRRVRIVLLSIACLSCNAWSLAETKTRNVVLILIDDLGWRDLSCYGSAYYQTPNIDRLAQEGVRFTQGYAACNVCSPTRASILTGKYPARLMLTQWLPAGRWSARQHRMREGRYMGHLPLEEVTIAEALREEGYRTAFMGKWHLGTETYYFPEHQGFDVNVAGRDYGAPGHYFYPFEGSWTIPTTGRKLVKDNPIGGTEGDYLPDLLAERAAAFIRDNAERPFFLMLSHYAVHAPLQGKPETRARYEAIPSEDRQGPPDYAAMVESIDDSVGTVVQALEDSGLTQNTLVIFTSDNGGFARATNNAPLRANKGTNYEGGLRVPFILRWPESGRSAVVCETPVITNDLYPTILEALDLPLRPYQHVDGHSLLPLLEEDANDPKRALYWHYPHYNRHPHSFPSGVIREGDWKLIQNYETEAIQLYNLRHDIGETENLAASQPERASRMLRRLNDWRDDVGADPMRPNPQFAP